MKKLWVLFVVAAVLFAQSGCGRKREERLHLFAWSEYVPAEVIEGFTKETGIPVDYEVYDSNEAMLSKLSPGSTQYDVIQPSEYAVEHLIKRGMLAPLDRAQLPNAANLDPSFRDLAYDPGQRYSVPYMSGTVGIVYNAERVPDAPKGYADVFRPEHKGRIVVLDDNREIVSWALSVHGMPINDVTPENLKKVRPTLQQWLPLVKVFDSTDPKRPLKGGDVDLGVVYSGDAATLLQQDKRFRYVLPSEGAHRFIDNLAIPTGATHKEAAHKFINYVLRPDVSKLISDKFPYTNPNAAARKLLTKEQLENPASYPANAEKLEIFHDIGHGATEISAMMTELRSQ